MFITAIGSGLIVIGESLVTIYINGINTKALACFCENARSNLLGNLQIIALRILRFVNKVADCKLHSVTVYPKLFKGLGTMPDIFSIRLRSDVKPGRYFAPRSIAVGLKEKSKMEL